MSRWRAIRTVLAGFPICLVRPATTNYNSVLPVGNTAPDHTARRLTQIVTLKFFVL